MELTCIMCPLGCRIRADRIDGEIVVEGNGCKRGEAYAKQESVAPQRVVTALFTLTDGTVVPCKTNRTVDKKLIFGILKEIQKATKAPPIAIGDILIPNVLETGADIVATANKD